jgi:predicted transposase/invertase (TIGR01784 family)
MNEERTSQIRPFLPVKYDVVFRLFFADERNEEELIGLLKSVLRLPEEEYKSIEIADPHLLPEYIGDKYAVIDVKLHTKSRKIIHIEIQLQVPQAMRERIVYYDAKLITEQMGSKDKYDKIQKVISIIITEENLIPDSPRYHHRFTFCDPDAKVELTDIIEIYSLELRKLPEYTDGTALYDWAKFIIAETEEELEMVAQRNPEISKAAVKLRALSSEERSRDLFERRLKGWRDMTSFIDGAEQKGRAEGLAEGRVEGRVEGIAEGRVEIARNLLKMNLPTEQIIAATGLTRAEIEALEV